MYALSTIQYIHYSMYAYKLNTVCFGFELVCSRQMISSCISGEMFVRYERHSKMMRLSADVYRNENNLNFSMLSVNVPEFSVASMKRSEPKWPVYRSSCFAYDDGLRWEPAASCVSCTLSRVFVRMRWLMIGRSITCVRAQFDSFGERLTQQGDL